IVWGGLGGRVAVRRRNSGVWGTWNRMWSTEDAPAVLGTTGRQQFPNGLIMQWGTLTLGPSGGNTSEFNLVFPIAFGTACVAPTAIASTTAHPTEGGSPTVIVRSVTRTGMSVSADALDYTTFTQNVPVYWQAIGY
ncbi:gp53-like domain-containing protein, partial [Meridianimarinicoccus sp. RP-17]